MTSRRVNNRPEVYTALLIAILMMLAVAVMVSGCTRTTYVPLETVRTEYVEADTTGLYERLRDFFESMYSRETSSDSVIDRQKETVVLKENGDTARHDTERTVYVSSRREKELEHEVRQRDSIIGSLRLRLTSVKADSIRVPYPVEPLGTDQNGPRRFRTRRRGRGALRCRNMAD